MPAPLKASIQAPPEPRQCGSGICATSSGSSFQNGFAVVAASFSDANGWNDGTHYNDLWLLDVNGVDFPDLCGRAYSGIVCQLNRSWARPSSLPPRNCG